MLFINIDLLLLVDHMVFMMTINLVMPNDVAIRVLPCDWCTDAPDLTFSVVGGNKHSSEYVCVHSKKGSVPMLTELMLTERMLTLLFILTECSRRRDRNNYEPVKR